VLSTITMNTVKITTVLSIAIMSALMVSFAATLISTPSFAAKPSDKGATVEKGFACGVGGGISTSPNNIEVITPSGRSNLVCHG
jgi:hypothetical protein